MEYAARAGTTGAYAGDLDAMAWYDNNSGGKTHAVGDKEPNAWGLYDMHGNVWEWCQDWKGNYPSGSVTDPTGPSSGSPRVLRGGGWGNYARYCRSAFRAWYVPGARSYDLGSGLLFPQVSEQQQAGKEKGRSRTGTKWREGRTEWRAGRMLPFLRSGYFTIPLKLALTAWS